ncbi:MAG: hypothetical protein HQ567_14785 [Candidatus Nealsonbacteria bacterium]|nr:hypothetical protein [Candidatus Nealsonbacteria bacterium]
MVALSVFALKVPICGASENGETAPPVGMTPRLQEAAKEGLGGAWRALGDEDLSAEEVRAVEAYVRRHPDVSSFAFLMTLSEQVPDAHAKIPDKTKAAVLCDALEKCVCVNWFGVLRPRRSYDDLAAKQLLAVGKEALPRLERMLKNKKEAMLAGSIDATYSTAFKYRRADFAYRYIMLLRDEEPSFSTDPKKRDKLIAELQKKLKEERENPNPQRDPLPGYMDKTALPVGMTFRLQEAVKEGRAGRNFGVWRAFGKVPLSAGEVLAVETYVREQPDVSSFVLLMALSEEVPEAYSKIADKTKAAILCDTLEKSVWLNKFGNLLPQDSYHGRPAKALLAVGKEAMPGLERLLTNKKEAPIAGAVESTYFSKFKYRRADFAYRYIMLLRGEEPSFPTDPKDRDKLIAELQKKLKEERNTNSGDTELPNNRGQAGIRE